MTRALVVEHIREEGAGMFAGWLPAYGLHLDTHRVWADGPPPATLPEAYDALVVMGGAMGVGDLDPAEHELVRTCSVPFLGICLGAQLLAAARGGLVQRGRVGPELGVGTIHRADAAAADPLLADIPPVAEAVQWHWDEIVALPPGSTLLAGSAAYPHQAFRVGAHAWGLQFHPEATPAMVARWAAQDAAEVRAAGADPDDLTAAVTTYWPEAERRWVAVAKRFAEVVRNVRQDAGAAASKVMPTPHGGLSVTDMSV